MSAGPQTDGGGGGDDASGGSPLSLSGVFSTYIDRSNPRLLGKVDFLGIAGVLFRAGVYTAFAALIAIPLAFAGAFEEVMDALGFAAFELPAQFLIATLRDLQGAAIAIAAGELPVFEAFALPVSAAAALGPALVVAVAIALAWGFD